MRTEPDESAYHEEPHAESEFTPQELRHARFLLRRLRFLEAKIRDTGGIGNGSGGGAFAEMELGALEWMLTDMGFLAEKTPRKT